MCYISMQRHHRQKFARGESVRFGGLSVRALVVGFASPSLFGVTLHHSMLRGCPFNTLTLAYFFLKTGLVFLWEVVRGGLLRGLLQRERFARLAAFVKSFALRRNLMV